MFGSKKYPSCWTGREVPLPLVHFDGVTLPNAAPHEGKRARGSCLERSARPILDMLEMLGPAEQQRLFGTKLGPAGGGGKWLHFLISSIPGTGKSTFVVLPVSDRLRLSPDASLR